MYTVEAFVNESQVGRSPFLLSVQHNQNEVIYSVGHVSLSHGILFFSSAPTHQQ